MTRKYLKDFITDAGGTLPLRIESIGSPETNDKGWVMRRVEFKMTSTGQILTENLFDNTFKFDLKSAKPGTIVEAFLKTLDSGKQVAGFRIISHTADSGSTASQNNTQQVASERKATQAKRDEDEYWAKKDIGASLGMLVKIAMSKEADFDKALSLAKEWRPKFQKAVEECYALDKYKAKEESPDTSVKVPLPDHIGAVFGEDVSPTL